MSASADARLIPYYASSLVGRESEIDVLGRVIADPTVPLISLVGTAGVGKTRLATHIARQFEPNDNVFFISLADISDPALVIPELGNALGLQSDDLTTAIRNYLTDWAGLIVLDNLEQVIESASDISAILPQNDGVTFLVTSQRPLQIDGERVVRLDPLPVPPEGADMDDLLAAPSVRLLVERVRSQGAPIDDDLGEESTTRTIGEICRHLDGIPLAIELAAPRLASLSPEVVLGQLERGQDILSSRRQDLPARQRTMHSAITWSFQQLPEDKRHLFLWLGPFTGGFDLEIVERLSGHLGIHTPAFETISDLMNLSLIRRVHGGANPWYSMLVSLREFCLGELKALDELEGANTFVADYVIELAERSKTEFMGPAYGEWMAFLERQRATIRSAVAWAIERRNPVVPLQVAAGAQYLFEIEGAWQEVVGWVDSAWEFRDHDDLPMDVLINGMLGKLSLQETARDLEGANETDAVIQELLEDADLPILEMRYLVLSGNSAINLQNWTVAEQKFQKTLELAERDGVDRAANAAIANLGNIAYYRGQYSTAESYLLRAKQGFDLAGNLAGSARALTNLASISNDQGNYHTSLTYLDEAAAIEDQLGLPEHRVYTLLAMSGANYGLGELDAADDFAREAIENARELNYPQLEAKGLVQLAKCALERRDLTAVSGILLKALDAQSEVKGAQEYVQIGSVVAEALSIMQRFADSTMVLGKTLDCAAGINYTFDSKGGTTVDQIKENLQARVANYDRHIQEGESWSDETFYRNLRNFARRIGPRPNGLLVTVSDRPIALDTLTPRESEIVQLLVEGNSTQAMSDHLSVSPRTVTTHIGNVMAKLGVSSRAELIAKVIRPNE